MTAKRRTRETTATSGAQYGERTVPGQCLSLDAEEDAEHGPGEGRVEGELVADRHGDGEHPLSDGHVRQDVVDQVRREFTHAPAATGRTEAAPFAAERDDRGVATALTANAEQTMPEQATAQVRLELPLDKSR